MSITIRLRAEIEVQLMAEAMAQGVSLGALLENMIERLIASEQNTQKPAEDAEAWNAILHQIGKALRLRKLLRYQTKPLSRWVELNIK